MQEGSVTLPHNPDHRLVTFLLSAAAALDLVQTLRYDRNTLQLEKLSSNIFTKGRLVAKPG